MRVVALISGGKDSCYNMMQCIAAGHDIVALANLKPQSKGKLCYLSLKLCEIPVTNVYFIHFKHLRFLIIKIICNNDR